MVYYSVEFTEFLIIFFVEIKVGSSFHYYRALVKVQWLLSEIDHIVIEAERVFWVHRDDGRRGTIQSVV